MSRRQHTTRVGPVSHKLLPTEVPAIRADLELPAVPSVLVVASTVLMGTTFRQVVSVEVLHQYQIQLVTRLKDSQEVNPGQRIQAVINLQCIPSINLLDSRSNRECILNSPDINHLQPVDSNSPLRWCTTTSNLPPEEVALEQFLEPESLVSLQV